MILLAQLVTGKDPSLTVEARILKHPDFERLEGASVLMRKSRSSGFVDVRNSDLSDATDTSDRPYWHLVRYADRLGNVTMMKDHGGHAILLALERELLGRGHRVGREVSVNIACKGITLTSQRLDFVIDEKVVVEAKSTQTLPPFAARQLYNYLRATNLAIGLLLHFGPEPKFYRLISPRALHALQRA